MKMAATLLAPPTPGCQSPWTVSAGSNPSCGPPNCGALSPPAGARQLRRRPSARRSRGWSKNSACACSSAPPAVCSSPRKARHVLRALPPHPRRAGRCAGQMAARQASHAACCASACRPSATVSCCRRCRTSSARYPDVELDLDFNDRCVD